MFRLPALLSMAAQNQVADQRLKPRLAALANQTRMHSAPGCVIPMQFGLERCPSTQACAACVPMRGRARLTKPVPMRRSTAKPLRRVLPGEFSEDSSCLAHPEHGSLLVFSRTRQFSGLLHHRWMNWHCWRSSESNGAWKMCYSLDVTISLAMNVQVCCCAAMCCANRTAGVRKWLV